MHRPATAAAHGRRGAQREHRYAARKRVNKVALALSLAAMAFGVFWLIWILWETMRLGMGGLTWATLTEMTPPPNEAGGIANAIYGSFLMVMLATCVATPIGVMAGSTWPSTTPRARSARPALRQRHPAVGAVDRDRPVRLCGGGGALQQFSGWAGVWRWR